MRTLAFALAAALLTGAAQAQPAPPTPGPASPPSATSTDSQTGPATSREGRPGRGASIKLQSPGGAEIAVRCADGDSTRACADVVLQLLERTRSMHSERRGGWDRDRGGESRSDDWRRDRDRD